MNTRYLPAVAILVLTLFSVWLQPANGQITDQRRNARRKMLGDILEHLIESQVNRPPQVIPPGRAGRPPAWSDPKFRPSQPPSAQLVKTRRLLTQWEQESGLLVTELRKHETSTPALRPVLADSLATHAQIKALQANALRVSTLSPLTDSFCRIDANWRVVNHRLKKSRSLPTSCYDCAATMFKTGEQLSGLFGVQPQFNRRELARQCTAMCSSFEHLIQDIRYDMRSHAEYREILSSSQQLYTRLNESISLAGGGSYDQVAGVYNGCLQDWQKLKYKLVASPHGRIHRSVHTIDNLNNHISDLLWLDNELDRQYLCKVLQSMKSDADLAFQRVSLKRMLNSGKPGVLIACSRGFQNQCDVLFNKIQSNVPIEDLLWEYQQLSNQWNELEAQLYGFKVPKIDQATGEVASGVTVLRTVFGDGPLIDRSTMAEICGDLEQLAYQFQNVTQTRIVNGYEPVFRQKICTGADKFLACVHDMHQHVVVNRRYDANAAADVRRVVQSWSTIRPLINQCQPAERRRLIQIRGQMEPLLVKLQVVFAG